MGLLGFGKNEPRDEEDSLVRDELRQQLARAQRDTDYWENRWTRSSDKLKASEKLLAESQANEKRLEGDIDGLRKLNAELLNDRAAMWGDVKEAKEKLSKQSTDAGRRIAALQKRLKGLEVTKKELGETERELAHLRSAHDNAKTMLATRTAELRDAQAYLTKTDNMSHADVQRAVEVLNAQIFQLSALVTDQVAFSESRLCATEMETSFQETVPWLGESVVNMLFTRSHVDDPIWVQMSLQAASSAFASVTVNAWDMRFDAAKHSLLTDIHKELFLHEPQAVSARWRVLTRTYVKHLDPGYDALPTATEHLFNILAHILHVSGALQFNSSSDWAHTFREKIKEVVAQSLKIQKAIGEDVASSDFQIIHPDPNTPFSENDMEDVDDCGRKKGRKAAQPAPILFTTEIGLRRCEKQSGEDGKSAECSATTLLKAKVMLQDGKV